MAKTLILIRHGKALPRETWKEDDALRPLSGGGELSMEARLPSALSLIDEGVASGGIEVWSSPALRTMQTAQIVARILDAPEPEAHECLLNQDAEAFLGEFEASEASCVIAVGHNPFIDDVAARLSGVRLPIFTGATVALRVERGAARSTRPSARLLWFVQGPKASRWATLAAMEGVLARAYDTVNARLLAFFENPQDPETMHKFRVSIRTMRSLVAFAEPFMKRSQAKAMQRNLRTVVRWTSRLRELDVLHDQAASMETPCAELADAIAKARDAERERVAKQLKSKKAAKLLAAVGEEAMHVAWKPQAACEGVSRKAMRARFASMLAELERDLEALDISDAEATHDVRKEAKRVRYSAENFREFLEDDAVAVAKRMVKMQDGLGAICDARVNLEIIDAFPKKKLSEDARVALDALRASNAEFLRAALEGEAGGALLVDGPSAEAGSADGLSADEVPDDAWRVEEERADQPIGERPDSDAFDETVDGEAGPEMAEAVTGDDAREM